VSGVKPPKTLLDVNAPPSLLYSQPVTGFNVIVVAVEDAFVGAAGAVCVAFVTVAVAAEVTLPSQLDADTVTVIVLPISD
jgi:hypothetical protein